MMKKVIEKCKKIIEKLRMRSKLKRMDAIWYERGGSCFGLFPPSYYYKYSEEEMEKLKEQELGKLRAIIEDYKNRYESEMKNKEMNNNQGNNTEKNNG